MTLHSYMCSPFMIYDYAYWMHLCLDDFMPLGVHSCCMCELFLESPCVVSLLGYRCQLRCRVCVGTFYHLLAWGVVPLVPHGQEVGAF